MFFHGIFLSNEVKGVSGSVIIGRICSDPGILTYTMAFSNLQDPVFIIPIPNKGFVFRM